MKLNQGYKLHNGKKCLMKFYLFLFSVFIFQNHIYSEPSHFYVTARSGLILRESPRKDAKSIRVIPHGSSIELFSKTSQTDLIDGETDYWYEVDFKDSRGFVFGSFLVGQNYPHLLYKKKSPSGHNIFYLYASYPGVKIEDCSDHYTAIECSIERYFQTNLDPGNCRS
jgi:hypothetical protein